MGNAIPFLTPFAGCALACNLAQGRESTKSARESPITKARGVVPKDLPGRKKQRLNRRCCDKSATNERIPLSVRFALNLLACAFHIFAEAMSGVAASDGSQ